MWDFKLKKLLMAGVTVLLAGNSCLVAQSSAEDNTLIFDGDFAYLRLENIKKVHVEVSDQVSDGCWTSLSQSRDAVKLEFIRSGYEVTEETAFMPIVTVAAIGYQVGRGNCAVYQRVILEIPDYNSWTENGYNVDSYFYRTLTSEGNMITGPKGSMSGRIKNSFTDLAQSMLVSISEKKNRIADKVLDKSEGEAQRFWQTYFAEFK